MNDTPVFCSDCAYDADSRCLEDAEGEPLHADEGRCEVIRGVRRGLVGRDGDVGLFFVSFVLNVFFFNDVHAAPERGTQQPQGMCFVHRVRSTVTFLVLLCMQHI